MWVVVFGTGEELMSQLVPWVAESRIAAASLSGVGGFQEAVLGYFDVGRKDYVDIPLDDQVELLSLAGDISTGPDGYQVHAHVVCGRRDGATVGGHVRRAVVRPTLELVVTQAPSHLRRRHDPESGLALIDLGP